MAFRVWLAELRGNKNTFFSPEMRMKRETETWGCWELWNAHQISKQRCCLPRGTRWWSSSAEWAYSYSSYSGFFFVCYCLFYHRCPCFFSFCPPLPGFTCSLPSVNPQIVVCVPGLRTNVLWLIPSPSSIQSPPPTPNRSIATWNRLMHSYFIQ